MHRFFKDSRVTDFTLGWALLALLLVPTLGPVAVQAQSATKPATKEDPSILSPGMARWEKEREEWQKVAAIDVNKKRLKQLRKRAQKGKLSNIEVVEGTEDDPKLEPNSLDAILINNAYHHLEHYQAELAHMKRALKPGGKLAILDYQRDLIDGKPRNLDRKGQMGRHGMKADVVQRDLEEAGFEVTDRRDDFIRLVTIE